MNIALRSLEPTSAFRKALFLAGPVALAFGFITAFVYRISPWYHEQLGGTIGVAGAVGGYVGAYTLFLSYYRRVVLIGLAGALVCFVLPIGSVFAFLFLLKIPAERSPFWALLPAGLVGELLFESVKTLHFRKGK